jgi:nucleoside 2-deoxyribosyltransferase
MSEFYLNRFSNLERVKAYKISFRLRTVAEKAVGMADNSLLPTYSSDSLKNMLEEPEPTVQDKLILLLKHLGHITEYPGQTSEFDSANDYSVVCAKNYQEANFYFDSLVEQGLATREQSFTGSRLPRFKITANGWKELSRIEQSGSESSNAFIAMAFSPDRNPFKEAIKTAVKNAGYIPIRIDEVEHVNKIDDQIIAQIRSSKFLISDFTSQRNGVYFEAGFMLGLGRTVIWVCDREDLKNVHFDTRQYNTIDYTDADDLQTRLQFRIEAILGKGPHIAE